jgi:tRNA modification GTPase
MRYGHVVTPEGRVVDEALAVWMRAPHSFTAEESAELSCHGGPLVLGQVLNLALLHGARTAEPGEFTMRAFLNGRIDLTRAEATLDVVTARTSTGLALAQEQLGGWLARELREVRALILEPLAYCTALVDFPEDEVEEQPFAEPLETALRRLAELIAGAEEGIIYREGARAALIGLPNAGKSSLLNALLRSDRAIVTPIPGTTRDTLEETASLGGVPVVLVDTAGMSETLDPVERIGVGRSRKALAGADLVLLVVDATQPPDEQLRGVARQTEGKPTILVLNKRDQLANPAALPMAAYTELGDFAATVLISALHGDGLDRLSDTIRTLLIGHLPIDSTRMISSQRHRDALRRAQAALQDALAGWRHGYTPDLLAVDLTAALHAIGEVTGDAVTDDLLHTIFSRFCIGK